MTRRRTRKDRSKKMTAVCSAICGGQSPLGLVLEQWLRERRTAVGRHQKLLLEEIEGRRDEILDRLREVVSSHYVALEITTKRLADLGATKTAELLRQELPLSKRARSGDIGEILATEFVEQVLDFQVPIRRLQWKDGREMALRGDDIVAFAAGQDDKLRFLKGEAKSRAKLAATVVEEAATALDRDKGRPTRHSVLFVAKRLHERGEDDAATMLEEAVLDGFRGAKIEHLLFTFCGNNPDRHLNDYLENYKKRRRRRHAVGLRVKDHGDFIRCLYEEM